jgi:hypothetical protein
MQPIETHYLGYRFRSRLEARWAVFFHHANTAFEYEFQGFNLPSGPYLLDFYLPAYKAFIEVKPPPAPDLPPTEIVRGMHLIKGGACKHFLAVYGDPLSALNDDPRPWSIDLEPSGPRVCRGIGVLDFIAPLYDSANAARAARFEHGERPRGGSVTDRLLQTKNPAVTL